MRLKVIVIVFVAAAATYAGYLLLDRKIDDVDVLLTPGAIPADGVSSALLEVRIKSRFGNRLNVSSLPSAPTIEVVEGRSLVKVVALDDSLRYRFVAGFDRGRVVIRVTVAGFPAPFEEVLQLTPSLADRNDNGFPDAADLSSSGDRSAFRRWFVAIALGQLTHIDDGWQDRDCAGLLRYCFREALKRHDNRWLQSRRWLVNAAIPDVGKYNYPNVPFLGTRVFNAGTRDKVVVASDRRIRADDLFGTFADFAEASRLKDNSMVFVSRDAAEALPADVIFFLNDTRSAWPYHTMVYAGNGITVYHTGPDGERPGIVKRMTLAQLASHPDPRWHPVASNPFFLGYYRWRILA